MTFQVVIFPSLGAADGQQTSDFAKHQNDHVGATAYLLGTLRWAIPQLRLDGDYDYRVKDGVVYPGGFAIQEHNPADYAAE